jgi:RecA/RadA recombinase
VSAKKARHPYAKRTKIVRRELLSFVADGGDLAVIQAPPGSGKTHLLLQAVAHAVRGGMRVAVATQTNNQADDICRRMVRDHPRVQCVRFLAHDAVGAELPDEVFLTSDVQELPRRKCVVVGTAAKWGLIDLGDPFDLLFVEEAWQLKWADFMLLDQVAPRFVLIGDPGQIPPVVTVETARWETSLRPPHRPAPEVILSDRNLDRFEASLPATYRLPHDTTDLIRRFYDFEFGSWAGPGERSVRTGKRAGRENRAIEKAIDLLASSSAVGLTLLTPAGGPPLERDDELAGVCVEIVKRLLKREASCVIDGSCDGLEPQEIGLCATHHAMNAALEQYLPARLRPHVKVETAERWQGLERKVMVVVHPLSGVIEPSPFDLETGRLCVMASRHRAGLIVVTRDHLSRTLDKLLPAAEQAPGRPDITGRGHAANTEFWSKLEGAGLVVEGA